MQISNKIIYYCQKNQNYKKAKALFQKYGCSINLIPSLKKEKFDKYNIPSEFLEQWKQEYISQLYNDVNDYIENTSNIDEINSMKLLIFF